MENTLEWAPLSAQDASDITGGGPLWEIVKIVVPIVVNTVVNTWTDVKNGFEQVLVVGQQ